MTIPRRRMLFVAPAMPDAGGNGLAMRQGQFLSAYAAEFEIDLAVIPVAGSAEAGDGFARHYTERLKIFALDAPDTLFSLILRSTESSEKLEAFRKYGRPSLTSRLGPRLRGELASWVADRDYSLVHIGRLYLLGLRSLFTAPCMIDADEDDGKLFQQIAAEARRGGDVFKYEWALLEAEHASRMNAALLPGAAQVFAASSADAASLAAYYPAVTIIPNIVQLPVLRPGRAEAPCLLFVGTLSYAPNAEGLAWFIRNCWPNLRKRVPRLRLDIVGAGAPSHLRRLMRQPRIFWHGRKQDLAPFYRRASAVIVPLRTGGGSRIKMLEAAAFARPVAATKIGAAGTGLMPKRDFACAENAQNFSRSMLALLARPRRIGQAARKAVTQCHDPKQWQARILAIADGKLSKRSLF